MNQWLIPPRTITLTSKTKEQHKFRKTIFDEKTVATEKQLYENKNTKDKIVAVYVEMIFADGLHYNQKKSLSLSISNFFHSKKHNSENEPSSIDKKRSASVGLGITFGSQSAMDEFHQALKKAHLTLRFIPHQESIQFHKKLHIGDDSAKIVMTLLNIMSGFDGAMIEDIVKLFHTKTMESPEANLLRTALLNKTLYTPVPASLSDRLDNFYMNYPSL